MAARIIASNIKFVIGCCPARLVPWTANLARSTDGAIATITAILMTGILGIMGLGIEYAYWYTVKSAMQTVADAAAISAAEAYNAGNTSGYSIDAFADAAQNGWSGSTKTNNVCTPGTGVTVCVNSPPKYGSHTSNSSAIEVVISYSLSPIYRWAIGNTSNTGVMAHAVALLGSNGTGCLLALGSGNSIQVGGSPKANLTLSNCDADGDGNMGTNGNGSISVRSYQLAGTASGNITVTGPAGQSDDSSVPTNPFSNRTFSAPATCTTWNGKSPISPGAYCGLSITSNVTLSSGIYYIEGGQFSVTGNATVTSAAGGVTIVLTSTAAAPTSYATVDIAGNGNATLSALTSGPTAGLVFFGDPADTANTTETFAGNGVLNITGAIYFKNQTVSLAGNGSISSPNGCFEVVSEDITVNGNATLSDGCAGTGISAVGTMQMTLVE